MRVALCGAVAALAVREKWTPEYADAVEDRALSALRERHEDTGASAVYRAIVTARARLARSERTVPDMEPLAGFSS